MPQHRQQQSRPPRPRTPGARSRSGAGGRGGARLGAKRGPHGDLALAAGSARQQRVRDVGARNQQHERHHRQQREERAADAGDDLVEERPDRDAEVGVRRRIRAREPGGETASSRPAPAETVTPSFEPARRAAAIGRRDRRAAARARAGPTSRRESARKAQTGSPAASRRRRRTARRRAESRGRRPTGRERTGAATAHGSSTTTRSRPGWSSPSTKVRPASGGTPSRSKRSADTCNPSRALAARRRRASRPTPAPRSDARTSGRCGGSRGSRRATPGHSPSGRAA